MRSAACCAASAWSSSSGRRREDLAADAVDLHRLDDRVDRRLAVRAAGDEHGQLAGEGDPLLGEQRRPVREHSAASSASSHDPDALAVVPAARSS